MLGFVEHCVWKLLKWLEHIDSKLSVKVWEQNTTPQQRYNYFKGTKFEHLYPKP